MTTRILVGLLLVLAAFVISMAVSKQDAGISLIVACIAFALLPPCIDPAIIIKEAQIAAGYHPES